MRYPALLLLVFLLGACTAVHFAPASTPTPRLISRQQAIEIAVKSASMSRPEVSPAIATPSNIRAEQMLLWQAMYRATGSPDLPYGYVMPGAPVWYVTMDGLWQVEAAPPGLTPPPSSYLHHATEIIDAVTGMEIDGSLRP